jgi:hypothetical protein
VVIEGPALLDSLKSSVVVIDAKKTTHFLFSAADGFAVSSIRVAPASLVRGRPDGQVRLPNICRNIELTGSALI